MERTIKLNNNLAVTINYSFYPNITKGSVDAYLNRKTGDKDTSRHEKRLHLNSLTFYENGRAQAGLFIDVDKGAQLLYTELADLDTEAKSETVEFDQYASEYYC